MAIKGLSIIGESINDSVPSTRKLFEAGNIDGILELARMQDAGGAAFIDINVGGRSPVFMADIVKRVQKVTSKPLSIDTPDLEIARAGLDAYDPALAGGADPILNSISELRMAMFDLLKVRRFMPILLVSERSEGGRHQANHKAQDTFDTAKRMLAAARANGLANPKIIFDVGIAPIAGDMEGLLEQTLGSISLIHGDKDFAGVHMSLGLSNFTHMLPSKRADGSPMRGPLESAFLMKAMPNGLDMVVGSVKRNYTALDAEHPAIKLLEELPPLRDEAALERVMEYYS